VPNHDLAEIDHDAWNFLSTQTRKMNGSICNPSSRLFPGLDGTNETQLTHKEGFAK
jgi:hypothetical protein